MSLFFPKFKNSFTTAYKFGLFSVLLFISASFTQAATILVHGDSLSAGYGMNPEDTWVALLDEHYAGQHTLINSSISGETSRGGLERLPELLNTHNPDILIIELGANDGLRGYPIPSMRSNLLAMIDMAQKRGIEVALIGIRLPPNFGQRYTEPFFTTFAELSTEQRVAYLPFLLEGVAQYNELMQSDGLHPTREAQPIIAENVRPVLQSVIDSL